MKKILFILLSGTLMITSCGGEKEKVTDANGTVDLTYKFRQGQEFYVTLDWNETVNGKDSVGNVKNDTITMATTFKYVVERVDESGTADLAVTYDHMRMGSYDSDDSTQRNTREGMMFAGMVNYVLHAKIDNKGKVLELTGGDNFYTFGQQDSLVDDNACLRADLGQFFEILPKTAVKNGQEWETSHAIDFGYPGLFKNKCKFVSVEDSVATIEIQSVVTPNAEGKTVFPGGFILRQYFDGSRSATVKFDLKKGIIASSSYHDLYQGKATGNSNGNKIRIDLNVDLHKDFNVTSN